MTQVCVNWLSFVQQHTHTHTHSQNTLPTHTHTTHTIAHTQSHTHNRAHTHELARARTHTHTHTQVTVNWRSFSSLVLHGVLMVVWLPWLLYTGYRSMTRRTDSEARKRWAFKNLTLILCCLTSISMVLAAIARGLDLHVMERNVWALGSIWCCLQLLVLIIPVRFLGFIVIALWRMMLDDIMVSIPFSKACSLVALYNKYTRALTFENVGQLFILIYALLDLAFSLAISLMFVKSPLASISQRSSM